MVLTLSIRKYKSTPTIYPQCFFFVEIRSMLWPTMFTIDNLFYSRENREKKIELKEKCTTYPT